jgi:hypothetical protein
LDFQQYICHDSGIYPVKLVPVHPPENETVIDRPTDDGAERIVSDVRLALQATDILAIHAAVNRLWLACPHDFERFAAPCSCGAVITFEDPASELVPPDIRRLLSH